MNTKHEIVNDARIDAIKYNFTPPMMEEMSEDAVIELLTRLSMSYELLQEYVHKNSEYYTDNGKKSYLIKDVAYVLSNNR